MLIYIFITVTLLIASLGEICEKTSSQKSHLFFIGISFVMWITSFIRWEVGTDWYPYYEIFNNCYHIDHYEWGFITLNRIVKNTTNNYSLLLAILGGILFYFQAKAIKILSILPILTLLLLWGTNLGNIFFVRQSVATSILLYAIIYIESKSLIKYLIFIFIATLIHASSIAFLPAYWIYHYRFSKTNILIASIISISLGSIGGSYIWGNLGNILGGIYQAKIEGYMSSGSEMVYNESMNATDLYIRTVGGKVILILFFLFFIQEEYKEKTKGMINLFLFATIMLPITCSVSPTFVRMWTPYFQVQIFLMTYVLASIKQAPYKLLCFNIIIIMTLTRLYIKLFIDYGGEAYLPFNTIFSK